MTKAETAGAFDKALSLLGEIIKIEPKVDPALAVINDRLKGIIAAQAKLEEGQSALASGNLKGALANVDDAKMNDRMAQPAQELERRVLAAMLDMATADERAGYLQEALDLCKAVFQRTRSVEVGTRMTGLTTKLADQKRQKEEQARREAEAQAEKERQRTAGLRMNAVDSVALLKEFKAMTEVQQKDWNETTGKAFEKNPITIKGDGVIANVEGPSPTAAIPDSLQVTIEVDGIDRVVLFVPSSQRQGVSSLKKGDKLAFFASVHSAKNWGLWTSINVVPFEITPKR